MLLGKQGSMADVLDELTELSDNAQHWNSELRGPAAWLKGKHDQAVELLEEADAAGSLTAKRNAEVAAGKLMPVGIDLPVLADISETIDGTLLPDYFQGSLHSMDHEPMNVARICCCSAIPSAVT